MSFERPLGFVTGRNQSRDGATPIGDHHLAPLCDLVKEDG